ncbi:substrate-binding domain-containing protein [Saccharomonospora sp. NPDC046836]|uniref:PstS family phosphate ABC transporter substrate-binding protein n=1 Tax=Saccharomonospora sp. NPDC046836 TaxID=3156921 RepID=UPI0033C62DC7
MRFEDTLGSVAELLGSTGGILGLLAAAVIATLAPLFDRYVLRRKRIYYRVQYNSKIGLSPVDLQDGDGAVKHADEVDQLRPIVELLDRLSLVVIRVRNAGIEDISNDDFRGSPLKFTFGGRIIWNARISEPSIEPHREKLKDALQFDSGKPAPDELGTVRTSLRKRLTALFRNSQAGKPESPQPQWDGVHFRELDLHRREQFKLVVVLREPDDQPAGELTKDYGCFGRLDGGRIVNEKTQRRITWPRITATFGVLLTGVLIATLIANVWRPTAEPAASCAPGTLRIVGSSAFSPIVDSIAAEYRRACPGSTITTQATGSIDGVRMLAAASPDERGSLAALSDGRASGAPAELVTQPVAVILYSVVVNDSAGIDELTLDQLRGIYSGRYQDWNQLRAGPSLPIRIIGRGQESGTRRLFEQAVLAGPEGALSSDSCDVRDRPAPAPTIRCERSSEAQVIEELSATDGAIGYIDLPSARAARANGLPLTAIALDDNYPDLSSISNGYPFWTVEYLYTKGFPEGGSLLESFIDYLRSGSARDELQTAGYTPCVGKDGRLHPLCRD